jgi:hypothetical protein
MLFFKKVVESKLVQELQVIFTIILTFLISVFTGIYTYATYRIYEATKPHLENTGMRLDGKSVNVRLVNNAPHNIVVKDVYYRRIFRMRKFYRKYNPHNFSRSYWLIPMMRKNPYSEFFRLNYNDPSGITVLNKRVIIKDVDEIVVNTDVNDMRGRIKIYVKTSAGTCSTFAGGCLTGLSEEDIKKRGNRRWGFY